MSPIASRLSRGVMGLVALAVAAGSVSGSEPPAKEEPIKPGDKVVVINGPAPLKVAEKTLTTLDTGTELTAKRVQGKWVSVTVKQGDSLITGWIDSTKHLWIDGTKRLMPEPAETTAAKPVAKAASAAPSKAKPATDVFVAPEYSVAKQPGTGVKIDGRITRGSTQIGRNKIPTWNVEVTVANYTERTVRLGESMTILEKVPEREGLVGIYIARESKKATGHLKMLEWRYGLVWGVTVGAESAGVWPLGALPHESAVSDLDAFMLLLSSTWVKPYYPDGGYPPVGAGQQVLLREEILVPLKSGPEYTVLLPPLVLEEGKSSVQTVLRFHVGSMPEAETGLLPKDVKQYPLDGAVNTQLVADAAQPLWLRLHALNWLAESAFQTSADMLLRLAANDRAPRLMRSAAILNLGLHQHKPATSVMLAQLSDKTDPTGRRPAIAALGELGDSSLAAHIRPFLDDADEMLAREAVEAVGKLRDPESVAVLLRKLADRSKEAASGFFVGSPQGLWLSVGASSWRSSAGTGVFRRKSLPCLC
ncbi:MAG: hypothetical protein FJ290_11925 [Planctomycetes bacterium]|nr:hypothetical protein [Planctomycetota bacterium]